MKYFVPVLVIGSLIGAAVVTNAIPRAEAVRRTESELEKMVPPTFGNYKFAASPENPLQTYKMDKVTYDTLKPYGIVARVYSNGPRQFDAVVINSDNSDSFHDPRVCFQTQGQELLNQRVKGVDTKTLGRVPVTFIETSYNGRVRLAAYTYKGPDGYKAAPLQLIFDLFKSELSTAKVQNGTFYRFIALNENESEEALSEFIGEFLDAANTYSKGAI
jgi:hypothetical protein